MLVCSKDSLHYQGKTHISRHLNQLIKDSLVSHGTDSVDLLT